SPRRCAGRASSQPPARRSPRRRSLREPLARTIGSHGSMFRADGGPAMSKGLDTLKITSFRGASQACEIKFDPAKPLVMVFGENGSGKSTIADAVDFIGNRAVGSLDDRSTGSRRESFLPTVGRKQQDVRIEASAG